MLISSSDCTCGLVAACCDMAQSGRLKRPKRGERFIYGELFICLDGMKGYVLRVAQNNDKALLLGLALNLFVSYIPK